MTNLNEMVTEMVNSIDSKNAEYILTNREFARELKTAERFEAKGDDKMVSVMIEKLKKIAQEFNGQYLTPANVKVGDGVTMNMYSDALAGTVTKVTKTSVTIQQDTATLDPNWKPEIVIGGFAGHCTNQNTQAYTYERNENGATYTFRWSAKSGYYKNSKTGMTITKGRKEFYDYNF